MAKIRARSDLPKNVGEELGHLYLHFREPAIIHRLLDGILSREECRLIDNARNATRHLTDALPSPQKILRVVARNRQLTFERALLELARSLDLINVGHYELLRKAISEPVVPERNDVPSWDEETRELRYKGKVIRRLSLRATGVEKILSAFHEEAWPPRIDSPLRSTKRSRKLRETVRTLNEGLIQIKFFCDGTGEGVFWQEV